MDTNTAKGLLGIPGLKDGISLGDAMECISLDILNPMPREHVDIDPIKYEIAVHRIGAILREGSFALVRTSGSPLVTEVGEYMFALYDAEGHAAYVTAGVLAHLTGTEAAIKFFRYLYEKEPGGIQPGDQFIINDPYLLGIHTPDILIAKPIFVGDEIVAWVASLTHTADIGAKDPGGAADSRDIFQEGIRVPGAKIVERGKPCQWVFNLFERGVRDPQLVSLDIVAKIAGNNVAATRLEEFIKEEGAEFLKGLLRKMIYEGEDKGKERVRKIPDGTWRVRVYGDQNGLQSQLVWADVVCQKKGEKILLDLSESSPQNPGPVNTTLSGSIGCIFSVFVATIFWDLIWNRGIVSPVEINIPKGRMYNPQYPAPVYASPPTAASLLAGAVTQVVSKMAMAAGFTSEVCAPWLSNWTGAFMGGRDQYGKLHGTLVMDANGGGTGATPYLDGDDTSSFMLAPGAMMGDVESYESRYPILYLFRRQRTDSCGFGKLRGGSGGETAFMVHRTDKYSVGFRGLGQYVATTTGLFGGYPADSTRAAFVLNPKLRQVSTAKIRNLLGSVDSLGEVGELRDMNALSAPTIISEGDAVYFRWVGGGGYGDPLKRDPAAVLKDIRDLKMSSEAARAICGVVLSPAAPEVDAEATKALREALLGERRKSWDARAWKERVPETVDNYEGGIQFHESLVAVKNGRSHKIVCRHCGCIIGDATENYRSVVPVRNRNPRDIGHLLMKQEWVGYREYFCPQCATLIDVEPMKPEDPDIWGIEISRFG